MFERYSERSRRAIFLARGAALSAGANAIEPTHLLAAALEVWPQGASSRESVLRELGFVLPSFRDAFTPGDINFSATLKPLLNTAVVRADQLGHHRIRPEHLLLAFAEHPRFDRVLRDAGIRREELIASATTAATIDDSPLAEPVQWDADDQKEE